MRQPENREIFEHDGPFPTSVGGEAISVLFDLSRRDADALLAKSDTGSQVWMLVCPNGSTSLVVLFHRHLTWSNNKQPVMDSRSKRAKKTPQPREAVARKP